MESKNELESGFRVENIVLMEHTFNRIAQVTFDNREPRLDVKVEVGVNIEGKKILVTETVHVKQELNGIVEFSISVKMLGIFDVVGEPKLSVDEFGAVNGAAIIFPYLREIVTATCTRAGLGLIFIPPFDFTKQRAKVSAAKS